MTKRFGFTLAEVLITLGIIGVVAAMTIPTLISNTNGAQFKTAYKKALSTLNQAAVMNVALEDYDFSSLVADNPKGKDANGSTPKSMSAVLKDRMQSATNITDTYTFPTADLKWYLDYECKQADIDGAAEGDPCKDKSVGDEVTKETTATPSDTTWAVFSFADGTAFAYNSSAADCSAKGNANCIGFIDVNGATNPNKVITCTSGEEGGTGAVTQDNAGPCQVASTGITDVYPVSFYGQTVEPASDAARAVLFGK